MSKYAGLPLSIIEGWRRICPKEVSSGMKGKDKDVYDLILWTSCPVGLPCAQRSEWPVKVSKWLPDEQPRMIWSRQLNEACGLVVEHLIRRPCDQCNNLIKI